MFGIMYNGTPVYHVNAEILQTKIMPRYYKNAVESMITPLPPSAIVDVPTANGTVQVKTDANGGIVSADKKAPDWLPLAAAAAAAWLILG